MDKESLLNKIKEVENVTECLVNAKVELFKEVQGYIGKIIIYKNRMYEIFNANKKRIYIRSKDNGNSFSMSLEEFLQETEEAKTYETFKKYDLIIHNGKIFIVDENSSSVDDELVAYYDFNLLDKGYGYKIKKEQVKRLNVNIKNNI